MTREWQIPISNQTKGAPSPVLHFFKRSADTNRLVMTSCGKTVNPGFALSAEKAPRAHLCRKCVLAERDVRN